MKTVSIRQAKANFLELVEEVLKGEEVIIAKAGKPVAKLIMYKDEKQKRMMKNK